MVGPSDPESSPQEAQGEVDAPPLLDDDLRRRSDLVGDIVFALVLTLPVGVAMILLGLSFSAAAAVMWVGLGSLVCFGGLVRIKEAVVLWVLRRRVLRMRLTLRAQKARTAALQERQAERRLTVELDY